MRNNNKLSIIHQNTNHRSEPAKFNCAYYECPEWLGGTPPKRGCTFSYTHGSCCATGELCDSDRPNLHKCKYRGQETVKGEKFYPASDPCYVCTCDENFVDDVSVSSSANAKNCRKFSCGAQLGDRERIKQNCAPVYFGTNQCCPIDWICRKWSSYNST